MRAQRRYTPSRATTLPTGMDGATQIGSKHASQTKLLHGLTSSRVATIFAVSRQLDRTRSYSHQFSYLWVGRRPMRNSYLKTQRKVCSLSDRNPADSCLHNCPAQRLKSRTVLATIANL